MCPACIATTAMLIASAISSGGVAAVLVNKFRAMKTEKELLLDQKKTKEEEEMS